MTKNKKHHNGKYINPTVSILTVTQYARIDFLPIMSKLIESQDYSNIKEWVIVDGSKDDADQPGVKIAVESVAESLPNINVRYVGTLDVTNRTIGNLRNIGNQNVSHTVIICMDDDDYYPTCRVSHVVKMFYKYPKRLIAGCSRNIMYDYDTNMMYQFKFFGENHSVNTCMAYRREYLEKHKYDPTAVKAEEASFTNRFREPMIQLRPEKTVFQMSYSSNTVSKRKVILDCLLRNGKGNSTDLLVGKTPLDYNLDGEILKMYMERFQSRHNEKSPYDVVFYCGHSIPWDPTNQGLGGSEQSVVEISSGLAKIGCKVAVYANLINPETISYNGVDYFSHYEFGLKTKYNTLVLWRTMGIKPWLTPIMSRNFPLRYQQLYVDLHDNSSVSYRLILMNIDKITGVFYKSYFHWALSHHSKAVTPVDKSIIIANGIRIEKFKPPVDNPIIREPYRLCYASCYTRGLEPILEKTWPLVKKTEPRAELHVYYGMDNVPDAQFKAKMDKLLQQDGVFNHGRQSVNEIAKEKWRSNFHLYYTSSLFEIDCISIRESLVAGAIPILSKSNLFKYRDGVHIKKTPDEEGAYECLADSILDLFRRPDVCENIRKQLKSSITIMDWESVTKQWYDTFQTDMNFIQQIEDYHLNPEYNLEIEMQDIFKGIYFIAKNGKTYPHQLPFSVDLLKVELDVSDNRLVQIWQEIVDNQDILDSDWFMFIKNTAFSSSLYTRIMKQVIPIMKEHTEELGIVYLGGGAYHPHYRLPHQSLQHMNKISQFVYVRPTDLVNKVGNLVLNRQDNAMMYTKGTIVKLLQLKSRETDETGLDELFMKWSKYNQIPCTEIMPHPFYTVR